MSERADTHDIAEGVVNKTMNKWLMPIMLGMIGTIVTYGVAMIHSQTETLQKHGEALGIITSDMRNINTRLDGEVISQMHEQMDTIKANKAERELEISRITTRLEVLENQRSMK